MIDLCDKVGYAVMPLLREGSYVGFITTWPVKDRYSTYTAANSTEWLAWARAGKAGLSPDTIQLVCRTAQDYEVKRA